jgi:hypothetical protein
MNLIDRYLHAVRGYLPAARQDDIIRELSEDLHAQVSDREAELRRPLTEDEQESLVKKFGHPLMLAARYRPHQHVIGPALFPFYWQTLKIAIGGALVVHMALAAAMAFGGTPINRVIGMMATFPFNAAVTVFGWVTLCFAVIDLNVAQLTHFSWNPRNLPAVTSPAPRSRWMLLAEIVGSTVFLLWWLAVPRFPFLMFGPAAAFLAFGPVWHQLYLPVAIIWLVSLATLWAIMLRPDWAGFRVVARLITDGLFLIVSIVLLKAGTIVQLAPGVDPSTGVVGVVDLINAGARVGLLVSIVVSVWQITRETYRLFRPAPDAR